MRERIVHAAAELLESGGRNAVTTRAVSAAAGVQPPTIYRQFGDMQGLLEAVARETLAAYVRGKARRSPSDDPVEDLRGGWDLHIAFGLANPDAFALLYAAPSAASDASATRQGYAVLQELVSRVAEAGRLAVDVAHATRVIHAAGTGVTLTLLATPAEQRDPRLCETMREAILAALVIPACGDGPNRGPDEAAAGGRVAAHAVALQALLPQAPGVLSAAERQLLGDWLERLAGESAPRPPSSAALKQEQ